MVYQCVFLFLPSSKKETNIVLANGMSICAENRLACVPILHSFNLSPNFKFCTKIFAANRCVILCLKLASDYINSSFCAEIDRTYVVCVLKKCATRGEGGDFYASPLMLRRVFILSWLSDGPIDLHFIKDF